MTFVRWTFAFAVSLLIGAFAAPSAQAACLQLNVDDQVATGILVRGKVRSPKNPTRPLLLRVARPVCMIGANPEDRVAGARIIQIYSQIDGLGLGNYLGETVTVRGRAERANWSEAKIGLAIVAIEQR